MPSEWVQGSGLAARLTAPGLDLLGPDGTPVLAGLTTRVGLADGTTWTMPEGPWQALGGGAQRTGVNADGIRRPGGELALTWTLVPHPDGLLLTLALRNQGPSPLGVKWLNVLDAPWPGCWTPSTLRVAQAGWQSWSPATPPLPLRAQRALPEPPIAGPAGVPAEGFASPWVCELAPESAPGLTLGFLEATRWTGMVRLVPDWTGGRLIATCFTEGLVLAPGAEACASPLLLLEAGPSAMARYGAAVASHLGAPAPPRTAPRGWCSWYTRFGAVTEADVLRNAHVLAGRRAELAVEVVQLDDGWQPAIGDWLSTTKAFPRGLGPLVSDLRSLGFEAGLWLAPFVVGADSRVARRHPEWLLPGPDGQPVLALHNWGQRCHTLDLALPEVQAHLAQVVQTLVGAWGFRFLKLDFLYAGALPGPRAEGCSPLEAYRLGLQTIRKAAGNAFLLGCGAPTLPSVGLVDGMRVGPDVAARWWPEGGDPSAPALANALRSTFARGWMHGRWWVNDPDCLLLGAEHEGLTAAERQTWAAAVLLSGGLHFLSDEVGDLSPTARARAATVFAHTGQPATVLSTDDDGLPTRAWQGLPSWGPGAGIAALLNPADVTAVVRCDPDDWPAPPASWRFDLFAPRPRWRPWQNPVRLEIQPHGVRLWLVAPEPVERPLPRP
jgi:alpha-galactosidase